jgi:hypothetical protein
MITNFDGWYPNMVNPDLGYNESVRNTAVIHGFQWIRSCESMFRGHVMFMIVRTGLCMYTYTYPITDHSSAEVEMNVEFVMKRAKLQHAIKL